MKDFTNRFDEEKAKKPAIDRILSDKEKNEAVRELDREDEVGEMVFIIFHNHIKYYFHLLGCWFNSRF